MRNVTIRLDDETARWARIEAAKQDTSVSRLVGELLRRHMRDTETYERAHRAYAQRAGKAISAGGTYPSRDDVHSR